MNDVFIMVIVIVALSLGAGMWSDYLKTQRQVAKNRTADEDLEADLQALTKRVAVLEEIVTDSKYQLNKELERL